jgi:hypothetical protein
MNDPKPLNCSDVGSDDTLIRLIMRMLPSEVEDKVLDHLRYCPRCLSVMASVIDKADLSESPKIKM